MNYRCLCLLFALILAIKLTKVKALPSFCQNLKLTEFNDPKPDYCSTELENHIGCKDKKKFAVSCGKQPEIYTMTKELKRNILRQHNVYRNVVAKGFIPQMPIAARMLKMKWDPNLAKLAEYAVKKCDLKAGTKFNYSTTNARHPGYNAIYSKYPKDQKQDEFKILDSQMRAWYDEKRFITTEHAEHGNSTVDNPDFSPFIQLVTGLNDRVGCAIIKYVKDKWKYQLMVCLYGCYMQKDEFTYLQGKHPGSKCQCGTDSEFKNLCSNGETIGDCGLYKYYMPPQLEKYEKFEKMAITTSKPAGIMEIGFDPM